MRTNLGRSTPRRWLTALTGTALLAATVLVTASGAATAAPNQPGPGGGRENREVMANLFEWNWASVAKECTTVLGPAGYGGVQVSPPQDSLKRTALGDGSNTVLHPWWEVYQAVDYGLTSRMGNEAQFKDMVTTCRKAGVKVYVDTIINHTTGQGSISYGGTTYSHFEYPGLYTAADFHQKGADCNSASGGIEDFNNLRQVQKCELVGLADLKTESATVRTTLAGYLNKLISYGVSGFRVDAAKHVGQTDLAAIQSQLRRTVDGTPPYVALEIFGGGPGVLSPAAFQSVGNVLGLDAVKQIRDAFKSYPDAHIGSIATLKTFGEGSGLTSSDRTLSFVQNHDTERNGDALNYKDGATNVLANQFLLAYGYGTPQVYSGFTWTTSDDSPPSTPDGIITDTDCAAATWACVDRNPGVLGMVGWHNAVGKAPVTNWFDDGENLVSFTRGPGFAAFNNALAVGSATFTTGLPAGTYCDVVHGKLANGVCSGPTVQVGQGGKATLKVGSKDAVAFTSRDRVK
jgi:alpha-amylase